MTIEDESENLNRAEPSLLREAAAVLDQTNTSVHATKAQVPMSIQKLHLQHQGI